MADENVILALAKVLIAAAWADGELTLDEVNSMKDLLYYLPDLSARQWASLQIYLEAPVGEAERARLVAELREAIRLDSQKTLALAALDGLIKADDAVTEEEKEVAEEIRAAVESADLGPLSRLFKGMTGRHAQAVANAPNREIYLDDFVKNKVYYGVRRRLDLDETELEIPEESLRKLSLAGGVMALVARVNPQVTEGEFASISHALEEHWQLDAEQAAFVTEVAVSETAGLLDRYRLAREFGDVCSYEERVGFLDVLFAVAASDGFANFDEIEEIRTMAGWLKLSHSDFIEAKLKIPREKRGQ